MLTERSGSSAVFDRARENGRRFYTISQEEITNLLSNELAKITLMTDYNCYLENICWKEQAIN